MPLPLSIKFAPFPAKIPANNHVQLLPQIGEQISTFHKLKNQKIFVVILIQTEADHADNVTMADLGHGLGLLQEVSSSLGVSILWNGLDGYTMQRTVAP